VGNDGGPSKVAALVEVNLQIREAASDSIAHEQQWEFFCECGRPGCEEHVLLTVDAYSALHDGGGFVLAPGHRVSEVGRARRLADEAEALRAQAGHQLRRARKNLRAK
jgi:hypothetical protein